jgi:thiol:disulfide interchange protein
MSKKLSRVFFIACIASIFFLQHLHAQNIQFTKGTWNELLEKSAKENKLIFVDIYAVWCGPCKLMAKNIFTQPKIADQFNAKFVNYMIDAEKGEGVMLAEKYQVASFPTYLFIDSSGKLVYKIEGAMSADKFYDESEIALTKFNKK